MLVSFMQDIRSTGCVRELSFKHVLYVNIGIIALLN